MEVPIPHGTVNAGATLVKSSGVSGVRWFNWGATRRIQTPTDMKWGNGYTVYSRGIRKGAHGIWTKGGGFITPTPFSGGWSQFATYPFDVISAQVAPGGFYCSRSSGEGFSYDELVLLPYRGALYCSGPTELPGFSINDVNRSFTSALADAKMGAFNLGTAIAEAKESARTVVALTAGTLMILDGVRKKDIQRVNKGAALIATGGGKRGKTHADRIQNTFTGTWLNWQYGIAPLIGDIHDAYQAFCKGLARPGSHVRSVGRGKSSKFESFGREWLPNTNNAIYRISATAESRNSARTTLDYRIDDPWLAFVSGLGLTNPATIAWELVSLSFVVDWFLPIGKFLESLQPPLGMTYLRGQTSVMTSLVVEGRFAWAWAKQSTIEQGTPNRSRLTALGCDRRVIAKDPLLGKLFLKSPFSETHTISALALLNNMKGAR